MSQMPLFPRHISQIHQPAEKVKSVGHNFKMPKKISTLKRYQRVVNLTNWLFNEKRLRYDDVIEKVADELGYSTLYVVRILKHCPDDGYWDLKHDKKK